jgi:hypothetical protein
MGGQASGQARCKCKEVRGSDRGEGGRPRSATASEDAGTAWARLTQPWTLLELTTLLLEGCMDPRHELISPSHSYPALAALIIRYRHQLQAPTQISTAFYSMQDDVRVPTSSAVTEACVQDQTCRS